MCDILSTGPVLWYETGMIPVRPVMLFLAAQLLWLPLARADEDTVLPDAEPVSEQTVQRPADILAAESRVLLSACILQGSCPDEQTPIEAAKLASRALGLEDGHVEARLQLAIALSMQARDMPLSEAREGRYAERMRALAEGVLEDDPDNAWAHGFMAVWHVEVRRRGGVFGAAFMGASLNAAEKHFEAITRTAPDNLILKWQYARALAGLDAERFDDEIKLILTDILDRTPKDDLEICAQERATLVLQNLGRKDYASVEQLASRLM